MYERRIKEKRKKKEGDISFSMIVFVKFCYCDRIPNIAWENIFIFNHIFRLINFDSLIFGPS